MAVKSYALTTPTRLKEYLGLSGLTAVQETLIERIIDSATEYIENYCQRRFQKTTYTQEVYDGMGSEFLQLNQYPVDSSEAVSLGRRASAGNEDDWSSIDSDNYFVHYESGLLEYVKGSKFTSAPRKYRVTYTAGFTFDNSSTFLTDTEAGDVEMAMWRICASAWNRRKGDPNVKQESIGDYSVSYTSSVFESPEMQEILDKYARVSVKGMRT